MRRREYKAKADFYKRKARDISLGLKTERSGSSISEGGYKKMMQKRSVW